MAFTVATWNINSVRLRIGLVTRYLADHNPDVLCLQETKCVDQEFPRAAFEAAGYPHIVAHGMKSYNGVAIVSRRPIEDSSSLDWCGKSDRRHLVARIAGVEVHSLYIPAGGDEPDPAVNEKFAHKLQFVDEVTTFLVGRRRGEQPIILAGDFNIAPLEHDVWSHKQLLDVVSHTPVEVAALARLQASLDWIDTGRKFTPPDQKLYSWWSYRAKDWTAADRGRRLDHIWATPALADKILSHHSLRDARSWEKPSDHIPIATCFDL